jgi:hypothetical protein
VAETRYDISDDAQVSALWAELVRLRFDRKLEMDGTSPDDIRDMLSDIDWYKEMWEPACQYDWGDVGFTPVAGRTGRWKTYMWRQENRVTLVIP